MKSLIRSIIAVGFFSAQLSAQVKYPTQPKTGYYENLKKEILSVVPSKKNLMEMKAETIPAGLIDTLLKYDWYEIANVSFVDSSYSTYWPADLEEKEKKFANNQFNFKRYTAAGIIYEMQLDRLKGGTITVNTTTFDETTAGKLVEVKTAVPKAGKKPATKNMLITSYYGEKDPQEILSYKNGILIMNVKQSPTAKTKRFHIAYRAVVKSF